jgi:ectoine hydroxylase-related dioxygenase (phytanoyl-CoA dioxygenase family)
MPLAPSSPAPTWLAEQDCDLEDLRVLVERSTDLDRYPGAWAVGGNVLLYDGSRLRALTEKRGPRRHLQAELAHALMDGPGVVVVERAFDPPVVDRATAVFEDLLAEHRLRGNGRSDHFAAPGANERLWDAFGKLALRAPEVFADYYANEVVRLVSEAWLGPAYQVTSQVNVVNPGGEPQTVHCDYHLGFLGRGQVTTYPSHVHRLSQALTLQGAVAHDEMPIESGPTLYLPYSQRYPLGYLAWHLPEFRRYTERHHVQLALGKGDAVFFNPAVFHAAGANRSTALRRMANLLQISSPFGRAMESVDRDAVVNAVYPVLLQRRRQGAGEPWLRNVVAASADGYPFPTNVDLDAPDGGLAPRAPADVLRQALEEEWTPEVLRRELLAKSVRRRPTGTG